MQKIRVLLLTVTLGMSSQAMGQTPQETGYVSWHPDGAMIAVASGSTVEIMDVESQTILNRFEEVEVVAEPAWSPDGELLAFANRFDVEVWEKAWDEAQASQIADYQYYPHNTPEVQLVPIAAIAWSPNGSEIASAAGSQVEIWTVSTGEQVLTLPIPPVRWDIVPDLDWSVDNRIAIANISGTVWTLDPITGEILSGFRASAFAEPPPIFAVDFSPDGDELVLASDVIQIWGDTRLSTLMETPILVYSEHSTPVITIDWSPSGHTIASGGYKFIRVWEAATGEDILVINLGEDVRINSVAWSPSGSQLTYTDPDGKLQIVEVRETSVMPNPTKQEN